MNYKVEAVPNFKKEAKRLIKKFRSLKKELAELAQILENEPHTGTPLGNDCYKIRLSMDIKQKGKSGGAIVITYVYVDKTTVYLLTLYDKGEYEDIPDKELTSFIKTAKAP